MSRLKTVIAAVLAGVYPLLAAYCLLEMAGVVVAVDCCAETSSHGQSEKSACGGYGCCPIEYAAYSSHDSGVVDFNVPQADEVVFTIVLLPEHSAEVPITQLEQPPPEILKSWQFSFRAALLARAPSIVS